MNNLLTSILTNLRSDILIEEQHNEVDDILIIYPGNFQPFTVVNEKIYQWCVKKFGDRNVWLSTPTTLDSNDSPFSIIEKKTIFRKYGIRNVIPTDNVVFPKKFIDRYDAQKTAVIVIADKEHVKSVSKYKRNMKYNQTTLLPIKDIDNPYIYYIPAPNMNMAIPKYGSINDTSVQKALSDTTADSDELKSRFKTIFGWFDDNIYNMVISKLNPNTHQIKESAGDWIRTFKSMSREQFKLFYTMLRKEYDDTKNLIPIIKSYAKTGTITDTERKQFNKQLIDISKLMGLGAVAAIPLPGTTLLIPVIIQLFKKYGVNILPESDDNQTQIVTRDFWDMVFENVSTGGTEKRNTNPMRNNALTFGELKQIIYTGLSGKVIVLQSKSNPTVGKNIFVSLQNGNVRIALTYSDIKSGGVSLNKIPQELRNDDITIALKEFRNQIIALNSDRQTKMFNDGKNWVKLKSIVPSSHVMSNHDGIQLDIEDVCIFSDTGAHIGSNEKLIPSFVPLINRVNIYVRNSTRLKYGNPSISTDGEIYECTTQEKYITKINSIQAITGCNDTDTIGTWHKKWWDNFIHSRIDKKYGILDASIYENIIKRWLYADKNMKLQSTVIMNPELLTWLKDYERNELQLQLTKNSELFDSIMVKFSMDTLIHMKKLIQIAGIHPNDKVLLKLDADIEKMKSNPTSNFTAILIAQLSALRGNSVFGFLNSGNSTIIMRDRSEYAIQYTDVAFSQLLKYFE